MDAVKEITVGVSLMGGLVGPLAIAVVVIGVLLVLAYFVLTY